MKIERRGFIKLVGSGTADHFAQDTDKLWLRTQYRF